MVLFLFCSLQGFACQLELSSQSLQVHVSSSFRDVPGLGTSDVDLGPLNILGLSDTFFKYILEFCSGKEFVVFVPADQKSKGFLRTHICGMIASGVDGSRLFYVVFDRLTENVVKSFGLFSFLVDGLRFSAVKRHWFKLVVPLVVLRSATSCFVVDSDVILLDDFQKLWSSAWDMEFASDCSSDVKSQEFQWDWKHEVNSGLVKYRPTESVVSFLEEVIASAPRLRKHRDQALINFALNRSQRWRDGWRLNVTKGLVRWAVLEPVRAPNGGVLLCEGRERLARYARQQALESPVAVHLNYHVPPTGKAVTVKVLGWDVSGTSCTQRPWQFWRNDTWPVTWRCVGGYVRYGRVTQRLQASHN